jgi:hypothetical protein
MMIEDSPVGFQQKPQEAVEFLDSFLMCKVRLLKDGSKQLATMRAGQKGFAEAQFEGGDWVETEMPNLMLLPSPLKRPAARKPLKRPASSLQGEEPAEAATESEGAAEEVEAEAEEEDEEEEEAEAEAKAATTPEVKPAPAKGYIKMWYKNNNSYGFREKGQGGRQIGSIIGKTMQKAEMEKVADQVLDKLHAGQNALQVICWARTKMK